MGGGRRNSSSKDTQRFLRIKWMKAAKETKKAGACRHDHPVRSEWKRCLLVALSRRAGISRSEPFIWNDVADVWSGGGEKGKRKKKSCLDENLLQIYVTADFNPQKAPLLTNEGLVGLIVY